jgi:hypothetical protein
MFLIMTIVALAGGTADTTILGAGNEPRSAPGARHRFAGRRHRLRTPMPAAIRRTRSQTPCSIPNFPT